MSKYFTVEKKIEVAASKQHAAAFGGGDVICDWTPIQVPKGASLLRSITALVRPKGDASPTINAPAMHVVFSKTNTVSLGTVNDSLDHRPSNDFLAQVEFTTDHYASGAFQSTSIATSNNNGDGNESGVPFVLQGDPTTGDNVGFDTIYVGLIAGGSSPDFTSINVINDADINSTAVTAVVMAGTSMDVREHFAVGDILHAEDDTLLGTVESIGAAATGPINLTAATSGAGDATTVTNGDTIYNIHPIKLILGFEK